MYTPRLLAFGLGHRCSEQEEFSKLVVTSLFWVFAIAFIVAALIALHYIIRSKALTNTRKTMYCVLTAVSTAAIEVLLLVLLFRFSPWCS